MKFSAFLKNFRIRRKSYHCSGLISFADYIKGCFDFTFFKFLPVNIPLNFNFDFKVF